MNRPPQSFCFVGVLAPDMMEESKCLGVTSLIGACYAFRLLCGLYRKIYKSHDMVIMSATRSWLRKRKPQKRLPHSRSLGESGEGCVSRKDTELHRNCESSSQQSKFEVVMDLQTPFFAPHNSTQGTYIPASNKLVKGNHFLAS